MTWADSFATRLRGLVGSPQLQPRQAFVLPGVSQIHTIGMIGPLDVVFCGSSWEVRRVIRAMRPWRISSFIRGCALVIELRASGAASIDAGHVLVYERDQVSER